MTHEMHRRTHYLVDRHFQLKYTIAIAVTILAVMLVSGVGIYVGIWSSIIENFSKFKVSENLETAKRIAGYEEARYGKGDFRLEKIFREAELLSAQERDTLLGLVDGPQAIVEEDQLGLVAQHLVERGSQCPALPNGCIVAEDRPKGRGEAVAVALVVLDDQNVLEFRNFLHGLSQLAAGHQDANGRVSSAAVGFRWIACGLHGVRLVIRIRVLLHVASRCH